ncbi:MAG: hypothetical protein U0744_20575 [Gemmataceae bacterium]
MRMVHAVVALVLWSQLVGCGGQPKPVPTAGKLVWDDGTPLVATSIRFVPVDASKGREATGYTGKGGEFVMSTFSQGDGVMIGEYAVVVTKTQAPTASVAPAGEMTPEQRIAAMKKFSETAKSASKVVDPIPPAYANDKSTPIKWKVESENNAIELKLKKI